MLITNNIKQLDIVIFYDISVPPTLRNYYWNNDMLTKLYQHPIIIFIHFLIYILIINLIFYYC